MLSYRGRERETHRQRAPQAGLASHRKQISHYPNSHSRTNSRRTRTWTELFLSRCSDGVTTPEEPRSIRVVPYFV